MMKKLPEDIVSFFRNQGCVVVSTVETDGSIHNSCKGIVDINTGDRIYLLDLYTGKTFQNLKKNPNISITAVDEHKFIGYCLKGKAELIERDGLDHDVIISWEKEITNRVTRRLIKNIRGEKGHHRHPEALLPKPEYMIVMNVEEILDLKPGHLD